MTFSPLPDKGFSWKCPTLGAGPSVHRNSRKSNQEKYHPSLDHSSSDESALVIEKIPKGHQKALPQIEATTVQGLQMFVVPQTRSKTRFGNIIYKPIMFHGTGTTDTQERARALARGWASDSSESDEEQTPIDLSRYSEESRRQFLGKSKRQTTIPRAAARRFEALWTPYNSQIVTPEGNVRNTRGLGYRADQDGTLPRTRTILQYRYAKCMATTQATSGRPAKTETCHTTSMCPEWEQSTELNESIHQRISVPKWDEREPRQYKNHDEQARSGRLIKRA